MARSNNSSRRARAALLLAALTPVLAAQGINALGIAPAAKAAAKPGAVLTAKVTVQLRPGYHVNSHTPSDEYLIPLTLKFPNAPFPVAGQDFPQPKLEKYSFSEKPLSVFSGEFDIVTRFQVPDSAKPGMSTLSGRLRFQACNDRMCLPPKSLDVQVPIEILNR